MTFSGRFSGISQDILKAGWWISQDFPWAFLGLSQNFIWTFSGLFRTFSRLSKNFPIIFSGLSHNFLRTFLGLSHNFLRNFSGLSPDIWHLLSWPCSCCKWLSQINGKWTLCQFRRYSAFPLVCVDAGMIWAHRTFSKWIYTFIQNMITKVAAHQCITPEKKLS